MKIRIMTWRLVVLPMMGLLALAAQAGAVGPSSVVAIASTPSGHGYWLMNAAGQVFNFGDALSFSSVPAEFSAFPAEEGFYSGLAVTPDGKGLWAVTLGPAGVGGHVNTLGMARSFGNFALPACPAGSPCPCCKGLVAATNGTGLVGFTADGHVQILGRARNFGDFASHDPDNPTCENDDPDNPSCLVGLAAPTNGKGLWAVTLDGHVDTLGRVRNFGDFASGGGGTAGGCCSGLVAPTNGMGLWGFSADGHVQSLGRAPDLGDLPTPLSGDGYTSVVATPSGRGLWAVTEGGHVGTLGDAFFFGDLSDSGVCLSCVP